MSRYIFTILFISCWGHLVLGQVDTVRIEDIIVTDQLSGRSAVIGAVTETVEFTENQSLAQALSQQTNIHIKNYGSGSLSTPSIRGGSAGHTLVLWNGLPLQSPMLGLLDFSLISTSAGDQVSIQKGGGATMWGSGAVSGTIALDSRRDSDHHIENRTTIGSFGAVSQDLKLAVGKPTFRNILKYSHESSDRDFSYFTTPLLPRRVQDNAAYRRNHIIHDLYLTVHKDHEVSTHLWIYKAYTEIPTNTQQSVSEAHQEDRGLRGIINWKYTSAQSVINGKVGYFVDHNDYYDPPSRVAALNNYKTLYSEVTHQYQTGRHMLVSGLTYAHTKATADGYKDGRSEEKIALFVSHRMESGRYRLQTSVRQEYIDGSFAPLVPSIGMDIRMNNTLSLRAKISRDYRYPTLNDRYWKPGGNIHLLPESGWSEELGLDYRKKLGVWDVEYSATAFHRLIDNWILWTPSDGLPFWSAFNINKVASRGIEQQLDLGINIHNIKLDIGVSYDYIRSSFQSNLTLPKVKKGDQLIYVPVHKGKGHITASYHNVGLTFRHALTGESTGVNETIAAYQVSDLELKYSFTLANIKGGIRFSVLNVWDADYFIIERRPVPGRHYNIGITINY